MQGISVKYNDVKELIENCVYNTKKGYVDCIQNFIKTKPFGDNKFYIYTILKDTETPGVKKMYHQPRLTKPEPVHGTTLIKVDPKNPEKMKIIWTLPDKEDFSKFRQGKIFEDNFVWECIQKYKNEYEKMCLPEPDDLNDDEIREIYKSLRSS
jgi:hypothetical protein